MRTPSPLRRLLIVLPALACVLAACGRDSGWRRLEAAELRRAPLLRLPDEQIYMIASAPDGAVFVSTFQGSVYRRMPGGGAWTRVAAAPRDAANPVSIFWIHPFSARGFVGTHASRVYRWREGQALREEKTVLSDSAARCGHASAGLMLQAAWGTEDDTYVVGERGNVLHYRGGRWQLERTPLTDAEPDRCEGFAATDLEAVGGADGWVYAAGRRIVRSRGDGRWEEVPGPVRDTAAVVGAIAGHDGRLLFAVPRRSADPGAEGRMEIGFHQPGARAGTWTEVARSPWPFRGVQAATAHEGGPAVFVAMDNGRIIVLDGGRVRAYWPEEGRRPDVRGAVPAGRDVLLAVNDSLTGLVVRLRR